METKAVLRFQLEGSFDQILQRLGSVSEAEWDTRPVAATSKVGFVLWHCVRALDWAVNRAGAGRAELADGDPWRSRVAAEEGLFGSGITDATADGLPARVDPQTVTEYLEAVRASARSWFDGLSESALSHAIHLDPGPRSSPAYRRPEVWAEIESLSGIPLWQLLARPAISHVRVHMGEVDALLMVIRAGVTATA